MLSTGCGGREMLANRRKGQSKVMWRRTSHKLGTAWPWDKRKRKIWDYLVSGLWSTPWHGWQNSREGLRRLHLKGNFNFLWKENMCACIDDRRWVHTPFPEPLSWPEADWGTDAGTFMKGTRWTVLGPSEQCRRLLEWASFVLMDHLDTKLISWMLLLTPGTSYEFRSLGIESTKAKKTFGNGVSSEKNRRGSTWHSCRVNRQRLLSL